MKCEVKDFLDDPAGFFVYGQSVFDFGMADVSLSLIHILGRAGGLAPLGQHEQLAAPGAALFPAGGQLQQAGALLLGDGEACLLYTSRCV